jgi:hypothetical protein
MKLQMRTTGKGLLVLFILLIFFNINVKGQTNTATTSLTLGISEVSLIRSTGGVVSLQLLQRDAGLSVETSKSDSTARILISSVITSASRTLSARITSGTVPTGTHLDLVAQQKNANFVGSGGTLASKITLDATDRPIITGIQTCYSGTAASDGYPLKFTFALDPSSATYGNLRATTSGGVSITVTLTLTAAQ